MLFRDYRNYVHMPREIFLTKQNVTIGVLTVMYYEHLEFPTVSSSIDSSSRLNIKKMFSENVERVTLASKYSSVKQLRAYDYLNYRSKNYIEENISFSDTDEFGHVDTTGVACRDNSSRKVIEKAISELIEKNELIFFWYLNTALPIKVDRLIVRYFIKKYGLESEEIYLFYTSNLSNWYTVISILFRNGKVIASGVCCNKYFFKSLEGAISELKIIKNINSYKNNKIFSNMDEFVYDFIKNYNSKGHYIKIKKRFYSDFGISLPSEMTYLDICFLNNFYDGKVVTVNTDYFIKCLPKIENLKISKKLKVVEYIDFEKLKSWLDCIIV